MKNLSGGEPTMRVEGRRAGRTWWGLVCVVLASLSYAQEGETEPSVHISYPNTVLHATARNVCDIDFRNIRLVRGSKYAQLHKGIMDHRDKEGFGFQTVTLEKVTCFGRRKGIAQYALVESMWTYGGGSSNNDCVVQVVTLKSERPVIVQQFDFDCHAITTGPTFDSKTKKLTVRARTNDASPHCCASSLDVVYYRWNGNRFEQTKFRRIRAVVERGPDGVEIH
jgi:hypothetical protein